MDRRHPLTVLAVDPGRTKCGIAVVKSDEGTLVRSVIPKTDLANHIRTLLKNHSPQIIILGKGTGSSDAEEVIRQLGQRPEIKIVDESYTSLDARKRYFLENPPRGLMRLIPIGLQTPNVPYDDYVAVILAERYIAASLAGR